MKKNIRYSPWRRCKVAAAVLMAAFLFGIPLGTAFLNGAEVPTVYAAEHSIEESGIEKEETDEAASSSSSETETEEEPVSETEETEDVSDSESEETEEELSPSVKITIETEEKWAKGSAIVKIKVEDLLETGNFVIKSVEAKVGQNGTWMDITEEMEVKISEDCTVYVRVTDKNGKKYERSRSLSCFDQEGPTLNAAVHDGLLSIQAFDNESGVKAIYVNGYEFTELTNGVLNIRLQQFDAGYQYFTIQAMDYSGNMSEVYKTPNPYYSDPKVEKDSNNDPAQQLPASAQATKPSSATGQVTEHIKTDNAGNKVVKKEDASDDTQSGKKTADTDIDVGKEFYTIQTASEKVFYLVIDRNGENEKVYFLTEISENDLLNTTSDNSQVLPMNSAAVETAIPTDDTALENNNKNPILNTGDSSGTAEETGADSETGSDEESIPSDEAEIEGKKKGISPYLVMAIVGVLIIAGYYFLVIRRKNEEYLEEDEENQNPDIFDEEDLGAGTEDPFFGDDYEYDEEEDEDAEANKDEN
ncbi:MAG: DUF4366 domain-containing protein [Lachnospiraceae bacterium]|nr:DUF4366 domain-containing protein [Lachnospiraceae bacterium]